MTQSVSIVELSHETGRSIGTVLALVDQLIELDGHDAVVQHDSPHPWLCKVTANAAVVICQQLID